MSCALVSRRVAEWIFRRRILRLLPVLAVLAVLAVAASVQGQGPGSLDPSFPAGTGPDGPVCGLAELPDGRVLVTGNFTHFNGQPAVRVARLKRDGSLDETFHSGLDVWPAPGPLVVESMVVTTNGLIYVQALIPDLNARTVARVLPDGSRDERYPGVVMRPTGSLLADGSVGRTTEPGVAGHMDRVDPDAVLLPGFSHELYFSSGGRTSPGQVDAFHLDGRGRLLIWGAFNILDGVARSVARLLPTGAVDATVGPQFPTLSNSADLWLTPDGHFAYAAWADSWPRPAVRLGLKTDEGEEAAGFLGNLVFDAPSAPAGRMSVVRDVVVQPDGKILVGGAFRTVAGQPRASLVRLNADGTLDPTFDAGAGFSVGAGNAYSADEVRRVLVQADGKVVVGGAFREVQGVPRPYLARVFGGRRNSGPPILRVQPVDQTEYATRSAELVVLADGAEPIAYRWQRDGQDLGGATNAALHLQPLQLLDAGDYRAIASNAEGSVTSVVARLVVLPATVPTVTFDASPLWVREGTNVVLSAQVAGLPAPALQWYRGEDPVAGATQALWTITNVRAGQAGVYHVEASNPAGRVRSADVRLEVRPQVQFPGQLDVGFRAEVGYAPINALALDAQGRILIGGSFDSIAGQPRGQVARLLADGTLDPSFDPGSGPGGGTNALTATETLCAPCVYALAPVPDGSGAVLVAGNFESFGGTAGRGLVRLRADGSRDPGFVAAGLNGKVSSAVRTVSVLPDGRVLAGGVFTKPFPRVARWRADGRLDAEFQPGAGATGGTLLRDPFTLGLTYDGTLVVSALLLGEGTTLVGGDFARFAGEARPGLVRLAADGSVDAGFVAVDSRPVSAMAVQADGRIVLARVAGASGAPASVQRLLSSGAVDSTFPSVPVADGRVSALLVQPDGAVVIAGTFSQVGGTNRSGIARLKPDGQLDAGFAVGFDRGFPQDIALALQSDGGVLAGGTFVGAAGLPRTNVARFLGGPVPEAAAQFIEEPVDVQVKELATTTFSVAVLSGTAVSYQWQFEGQPIAGATKDKLTLRSLRHRHQGHYSVTVSNAFGAVTSRLALLQVIVTPPPPPTIAGVVRNGDRIEITVPTLIGWKYILETSSTLEPGSWQAVDGGAFAEGYEMPLSAEAPSGAQPRFYRVRIE